MNLSKSCCLYKLLNQLEAPICSKSIKMIIQINIKKLTSQTLTYNVTFIKHYIL